MPKHKVAIVPNAGGYGSHQVRIDGRDLSHGISALRMQLNPANHPTIELDMSFIEVEGLEFETPSLYISDATREALIALGWKPPTVGGE